MLTAVSSVGKLFSLGGKRNKQRGSAAWLRDGNPVSVANPSTQNIVNLRKCPIQQQSCRTNKKNSWVRRSHDQDGHQEIVKQAQSLEGPMENYTLTKLIGQGAYGKVYTAQHKATGKVAAVKEVDDCQAGESEAAIMAVLKDCPSAVHLRDAGEASPADNGQSRFFIVMDLCQGGDLGSFVEDHGALTSEQVVPVAREVLQVVKTCQECRILHGDIKPCNLAIGSAEDRDLLQTNPGELKTGWLKLIDFGTSTEMGLGACTRPIGSPSYWAPEVFGRSFKMEADVWSVGILIFHLHTSCYPFWSMEEMAGFASTMDLAKAINSRQPDFSLLPPEHGRELEIDLLSGLLQKKPAERMQVAEAIQHPWLGGYA